MSESSAAGYQLRRHYQKYLLGLECLETGKNASEVVAFAERLKKRRKDNKDHNAQQYPGPGKLYSVFMHNSEKSGDVDYNSNFSICAGFQNSKMFR